YRFGVPSRPSKRKIGATPHSISKAVHQPDRIVPEVVEQEQVSQRATVPIEISTEIIAECRHQLSSICAVATFLPTVRGKCNFRVTRSKEGSQPSRRRRAGPHADSAQEHPGSSGQAVVCRHCDFLPTEWIVVQTGKGFAAPRHFFDAHFSFALIVGDPPQLR